MVPTPQEPIPKEGTPPSTDGERVVISGMSGLYPQSHHVKDLERILYSKENPVTDEKCRWKFNHPEVRNHTGKIPGLDRFDGQFFKVHYRLGNCMDAMCRKLLEQAYQAIYDAGICPETLSGKKVGVYAGSCFSETDKVCFYDVRSLTGLGIAGCSKTMFANRISYWLNAKGPSMSIDEACCSSIAALEQGYLAISRGDCDAAIVGAANLCLHPQSSVHYNRIMPLCKDGKTKSFDQNADGCAKSEAINVLFLQKAKDAKRIYADVVHVKSEFTKVLEGETGPRYGFYRDPMNMAQFLKNFYKEARVPPQAVEYVEAVGSAVPEADKEELEAIEEVFCKNRTDPLLVGSVMSNIGYGEAASGISGITKVLLGYQKGELAANLYCENPRRDVAALQDGRMEIVTDHKPFHRTYTAVNGIAVTGVNAHVLLHGHYKPKDLNCYKSSIPYLVTISGRQDDAVKNIFENLKSRPIDPEELALLHNIHQHRMSGHLGRGYIILDVDEEGKTVSLSETANYFDDAMRPLWFVYSGMGSQWAGMGTQLMRIPVFAAAIERCHKVLEPKGVDIVHIITSPDQTLFDNILNSFVGIAAVQIGLTDVLTSLGIVPDKIIGHSVGELGCAYADGCFTAEEMILSAYSRGLVSVQTPFIKGSMAAVGMGYQKIIDLLPPEVEVACHNGPDSCTISGPADVMKEFVAKLTEQSIFAKEVPCSNIAYHSRYIAEAGPGLLKYLSEVIKNPKPRTVRWVSTSVPQDKWDEPKAKFSSAYYHTNNLLSSVLFEETSRLIPANAVLVEIAPHGLLQAILKRSLPESCKHIPLTRRGHPDNAFMVLDAIGKLYMEGYNPKVQALYPPVEFPVSTGTPILSHLVEWAHNERWNVPVYANAIRKIASASNLVISLHDTEHKYLEGHVLRGRNLYPFAAALVAVWDTLAMSLSQQRGKISVQFRDVHLYAQPMLHDSHPLRLNVTSHRANGRFEVMDGESIIATGYIHNELQDTSRAFEETFESQEEMILTSDDVYHIFYEKDYFYRDDFRSIYKANSSFTEGRIIWNDNWVTFIDGILQMSALRQKHDEFAQVFQIRNIYIDLEKQSNKIIEFDGKSVIAAEVLELRDAIRCGGVLMENVQFQRLPIVDETTIALKILKFVPRFQANVHSSTAWQVYLQIVAENINKTTVNILTILDDMEHLAQFDKIKRIFDDVPGIKVQFEHTRKDKLLSMRDYLITKVDLVLVQDLLSDENLCQMLYRVLRRDAFIINEVNTSGDRVNPSALYRVISTHVSNKTKLDLVKWRPTQVATASTVVTARNRSELTLLKKTRADLPQRHKLVILSCYPPVPGLKELVKQWRTEVDRNQIFVVMISDRDNLEKLPELDVAYNVFVNGVIGGEYYASCEEVLKVDRGVTLRSSRAGDLKSLHWVETVEPVGPGIAVNVHYTAINDLDVKKATGIVTCKNDKEISYCMDFSGVTDSGQRVMGMVASGAASGRVKARPELLWPVPEHWSLEDAATVPSAYAHAFYCLEMKFQFCRGYRVLVLGAAGALGQAVISIALAHGCEVFAAVSDVHKKRFLMRIFPDLKEDHIAYSRDSSFGDMVRDITKSRGCNGVISCARGDLKNECFNSLSPCGIMIDTVQLQSQENYSFGCFYLTNERNYVPVDFTALLNNECSEELKRLQVLISEGIARGYVRPLSRVTYAPLETPRAFSLVAASRHRGRVLISLHDKLPLAEPRLTCYPDLCHVVLCNEQTFGIQLADRLVKRGARKLYLHCINPTNTTQLKFKLWANMGVTVQVSSKDLSNNNKNVIALLTQSNQLGPVEGIYVIATDANEKTADKLTAVVANLDLAARKLCPSIRYFAVISTGMMVGQDTCTSRVLDHLPGTALNLSGLRKDDMNPTQSALSWHSAVDATERALRSSHSCLLALPQPAAPHTLLQQIAQVADVEISEEIPETTTLLDLGLDLAKVPAVCSFLRHTHSVAFLEDNIPNMTLQKIRELEESILGSKSQTCHGLKTFFSYVDPDELLATTEMVFLPTRINKCAMMDVEFDVSQTYLCVVPGMEGHHRRFQVLCERLKLQALVLQPGLDHLQESLRDTAERCAKVLLNKASMRNDFYLLGYESGVIVALEMAAVLENHGFSGTVFCVGGTPEEFQAVLEDHLKEYPSDEALQDAVVRHMYALITSNHDMEQLDKALQSVSTWKEKVEVCVRLLLGKLAHSAQYARSLIDAAYVRIKQARSYKVQARDLRSKVVLLHASSLTTDASPAASLQRYSQQPIAAHELRETFANATQDLRCSAIVNDHLDPKILQAFEESNLCETYLLDSGSFMTLETSNEL